MSTQLVECVPNFSEGRDLSVIRQITDEIEKCDGVKLLDVDPGAATNRTVGSHWPGKPSMAPRLISDRSSPTTLSAVRRPGSARSTVSSCDWMERIRPSTPAVMPARSQTTR